MQLQRMAPESWVARTSCNTMDIKIKKQEEALCLSCACCKRRCASYAIAWAATAAYNSCELPDAMQVS